LNTRQFLAKVHQLAKLATAKEIELRILSVRVQQLIA